MHGPVEVRAGGNAYARRYAIWMRELETLEGLTRLTEAQNIRDVDRALLRVTWNENIIAADSQGNIGYWHPGLHPLRPKGFDERLPFPGTGEAEWRGLLPRRRTPHVINPKQGYVFNWNNVPSAGWTNGDSEASERATGPFHRAGWLRRVVRELAARPTWEGARGVDLPRGHDRAAAAAVRAAAARGGRGLLRAARALIFDALLQVGRLVPPGRRSEHGRPGRGDLGAVQGRGRAASRSSGWPGRARASGRSTCSATTGSSHAFDIANGEAYALRTLDDAGLRAAADATFAKLAEKFGSEDVAKWRSPRRMYEVTRPGRRGVGRHPVLRPRDLGAGRRARARDAPDIEGAPSAGAPPLASR